MLKITELSIEDELRRAERYLAACAELHGGTDEDHELAFELLDKVLVRIREIKEAYEGETFNA